MQLMLLNPICWTKTNSRVLNNTPRIMTHMKHANNLRLQRPRAAHTFVAGFNKTKIKRGSSSWADGRTWNLPIISDCSDHLQLTLWFIICLLIKNQTGSYGLHIWNMPIVSDCSARLQPMLLSLNFKKVQELVWGRACYYGCIVRHALYRAFSSKRLRSQRTLSFVCSQKKKAARSAHSVWSQRQTPTNNS